MRRGRKGDRTRESILRVAVDVASVEGLEGLSIGTLAGRLKMSKSGLFAHFGSKTELQLAVVEAARAVFVDQAVRPALAAPRGLPRLWALSEAWLSYVERKVFRGGWAAIRERLRAQATRRAPVLSSRRYRPPSSRRPLSSGSDRPPGSRVES